MDPSLLRVTCPGFYLPRAVVSFRESKGTTELKPAGSQVQPRLISSFGNGGRMQGMESEGLAPASSAVHQR